VRHQLYVAGWSAAQLKGSKGAKDIFVPFCAGELR